MTRPPNPLVLHKVQVVFQHYVISNTDKYFKNATQFEPERWLKSNKQEHHPFASLPFGYGKRMCLGRRFAELEIQTLITKVGYTCCWICQSLSCKRLLKFTNF